MSPCHPLPRSRPLLHRPKGKGGARLLRSSRLLAGSFGLLLAIVPVFLSRPVVARAQGADNGAKARATANLHEAERLFNESQFIESLQRLQEAHALFPSPKIFLNFGKTYRALGRDADALAAFERFLAEADPIDVVVAERRPEVEEHVRDLRARGVIATPPAAAKSLPLFVPALSPAAVLSKAVTPAEVTFTAAVPVAPVPATPIYRRWWFWAGAGAVAAAAITVGVLRYGSGETASVCRPACGLGEFRVNGGQR